MTPGHGNGNDAIDVGSTKNINHDVNKESVAAHNLVA
jgi:hypothetical protein